MSASAVFILGMQSVYKATMLFELATAIRKSRECGISKLRNVSELKKRKDLEL